MEAMRLSFGFVFLLFLYADSAPAMPSSMLDLKKNLLAASSLASLSSRNTPLVLPRNIESLMVSNREQMLRAKDGNSDSDGDGGIFLSQKCVNAAREYDQAATVKICQEIFGLVTPPPVYPNCPVSSVPNHWPYGHPMPPAIPPNLPDGSCCNVGSQCASQFCDPNYRVCTETCDVGGDPSQCPESNSGNSSISTCSNCACPQDTTCNTGQFCLLCPDYVGPANLTIRLDAACDVTTQLTYNEVVDSDTLNQACNQAPNCLRDFAEAAGVLAQPDCFMFLSFQGLNSTCPGALQSEQNSLILANLTWCQQNKAGQFCGLMVSPVQNSILFSTSQPSTCSVLQSAGCCVGNILLAYILVEDAYSSAVLSSWLQACQLSSEMCPPLLPQPKLGPGAIAGIVVACFVTVVVITMIGVWCYRRRYDAERWRRFGEEEMQGPGPQQQRFDDSNHEEIAAANNGGDPATAPAFDPSTFALFVGDDPSDNEKGSVSSAAAAAAPSAPNLEDDDGYPVKPGKAK